MSTKEPLSRKLSFGIFYLLSGSFASLALSVVTVGFVARVLGVNNFGLYSAIFSFVYLFQFLSDFGLNKTLLKFGSTDLNKAQISFGNALFVKGILALPTIALISFFGLLAGYREQELIILECFAISLILDSYGVVFSSIRRILGSFKLISFFRVLRTAINLAIIIIALSINNSVLSLAIGNMLLSIVIFTISLTNTVFLLKPKLRLNLIRFFLKDSIIFSLNDLFLNIYAKIGTVLLSFFDALHSVGIFSAAIRFTKIANIIPMQIKFALLPTMYRMLDKENKDKSKKLFVILLKFMVIFATPAVISIHFFSEDIIHLIFGRKYDLSIPLVKLFSLFIYLRFIETPFTLFYIALNKHKTMVWFQGLTSFLNIILNLMLIPSHSIYGACIATLTSEVFLAILLIYSGGKYFIWSIKDVFSILLKPSIAGGITLLGMATVLHNSNIFFQISFLIVSYCLLLIAAKVFNNEDKELFLKIFSKAKESDKTVATLDEKMEEI